VPIKKTRSSIKKTRHLVAVGAAATALLAVPAAAQARESEPSVCPQVPSEQVFADFGDLSLYAPVPGGGFEPETPEWTLDSEAQVVEGNNALPRGDSADHRSLQLPPNADATSPPFCVSVDHPTLRLFAQETSGDSETDLRVDIIYTGKRGNEKVRNSGHLDSTEHAFSGQWAPSDELALALHLPKNFIRRGGGDVSLRVTSEGGTWLVDDVYYDPRSSR